MKLTKKAQSVLDAIEEGELDSVNDLDEESKESEYAGSWSKGDGFWYALSEGYIKPEDILAEEEDVKKVKEALELLQEFETIWEGISFEM